MYLCVYPPPLISFTQPLPDDDGPLQDKRDNCPSIRRRPRRAGPRRSEITVSKTLMISQAFRGDASSIVLVALATQSSGLG